MSNYTRIGSFYTNSRFSGSKPVTTHSQAGLKKSYFFLKRVFDISMSLLLILLVLSWLLPVIALIIKLDSGGKVFFLQKRTGRNGRFFVCYKFRTMIVNPEADYRPATKDDPRITRLGKWLRRTNLDELPQLFNVLKGEMSIVGPRPHMLTDCQRFVLLIPEYAFRSQVKPGITGLAQARGFHGPAQDYESIFRRYQWDAFYVRNAGHWLDIKIIFSTFLQLMNIPALIKSGELRHTPGNGHLKTPQFGERF